MVRAGSPHPARDVAPGVLAELSGAGVRPESVISRARVLSVQRILCREGETSPSTLSLGTFPLLVVTQLVVGEPSAFQQL